MVDRRPTRESVIGPVLDVLGDGPRWASYIDFYDASDGKFNQVFERYVRRYTSLVPAENTVTPEEVADALREAHAQEQARRAAHAREA